MMRILVRWGWIWLLLVAVGGAQPWREYRVRRVAGVAVEPIGARAEETILPRISALCYGADGLLYLGGEGWGLLRINAAGVLEQALADAALGGCAIAPNGGIYAPLGNVVVYKAPEAASIGISLRGPWGNGAASGGMAATLDGGAYVAEERQARIFRISADGGVSIFGGAGAPGGGNLGGGPKGLATDASGNLYATTNTGRVLRVAAGSVEEIWNHPGTLGDVATTKSGEIYFVANAPNAGVYRVRRGSAAVLVLAGVTPRFLAVDAQDRLVYTSNDLRTILRQEADGTIRRLAGLDPTEPAEGNVLIPGPRGVVWGSGEDFYVADTGLFRILHMRRRNGEAAEFVAEIRTPTRPDLLARDRQGTLYYAALEGNEIFRVREGEAPVSHTRDIQGIQGLAARDEGLVVSTGNNSGLWTVNAAGQAQPLVLVGQTTPILAAFQLSANRNGEIVALVNQQVWRISRENVLTRGESGRPGNAAAAELCGPVLNNTPIAAQSDGALWFGSIIGLCQIDANGKIWALEERQSVDEGGSRVSASSLADFRVLGGMAWDERGRLILSVARTGRERVSEVEVLREGLPFALQAEVGGVRGAGGSVAPAVTELAPGGLISIFGRQFAQAGTARAVAASDLVDGKLPTKLASTCVRISGLLAPLTFVGETQINAQVPNVNLGNAGVTVVANCGEAEEFGSSPLLTSSRLTAPEFLYWVNRGSGNNPVVAVEATSGAFLGPPNLIPGLSFRPGRSGEVVTVYAVGFGPTMPNPQPGEAVGSAAPTRESVLLFLGGNRVEASNVLYAGASPGIAGLYQVNFRIPNVPDGEHKLRIQVGSYSSPVDGFLLVQAR